MRKLHVNCFGPSRFSARPRPLNALSFPFSPTFRRLQSTSVAVAFVNTTTHTHLSRRTCIVCNCTRVYTSNIDTLTPIFQRTVSAALSDCGMEGMTGVGTLEHIEVNPWIGTFDWHLVKLLSPLSRHIPYRLYHIDFDTQTNSNWFVACFCFSDIGSGLMSAAV